MAVNGKKKNGKPNGKVRAAAKTNGKSNGKTNGPLHDRWVYAYQLDPPQPEPRFKKINALVRQAQAAAKRKGRVWTGRIVVETLITHLLIVTDHQDQSPAVHRAIEAELKHLDMGFALNGPARLPWPRGSRGRKAIRASTTRAYDATRPIEKTTVRSR